MPGIPFRVSRGSETSPVRVEFLDGNGHVTHVRPGSGLELFLYRKLLIAEGPGDGAE